MPDAEATDSDPLGLVGTLIDDRYLVERLVGRGGMGYVYAAQHTRIQRPVAVKVLSQLQARRRFEQEAVATARIDHRNCVRLSDFGSLEDGTLYLVMELLEGRSLADEIEKGPIEPVRALTIARDILSALAYAHKQSVVHRDIKPENVILCADHDGQELAKVLDFGIAKMIRDATANEGEDKLTEVGMAIGTPTYMSPEQGFGTDIDGRSDVYSTSVLLFEMLTGKPPFRAETPLETLRLHIAAPPPSLASRSSTLTQAPQLEQLVADGMAKKPADRIGSADAFIERIDEALASLTSKPRTTDANEEVARATAVPTAPIAADPSASKLKHAAKRLWQQSSRRWLIAAAASVILVIVAILIIGGSGDETADNSASWPPNFRVQVEEPPSELAVKAAAAVERGEPSAAIEIVKASTDGDVDPGAQLALGHAYAAKKKTAPAIVAYARALEIDAHRGRDATLLANLDKFSSSKNSKTAMSAVAALIIAAEIGENQEARTLLASLASSHPKRSVRSRAQEAAFALELDGLDRLTMYTLDLKQGRSCKARLEAVRKLRKLGDAEAVSALRKSARRMSGGLLGIGARNINSCLRDEAREAADELEGR